MIYDIYCDESRQDLIVTKSSISKYNRFVCIGGIQLPYSERSRLKNEIKKLKQKYNVHGEIKWGNVSFNKLDFYLELVDLFFSSDEVTARTVVIDATQIDNVLFNNSDHELGYYKFYYQLLYHWVSEDHEYAIFTDFKTNKDKKRLHSLTNILNNATHSNCVKNIQAIDSKESLLLQIQNILMGAIGYKFNYGSNGKSTSKLEVIKRIEYHLNREISMTPKYFQKYNVFVMNLRKEKY